MVTPGAQTLEGFGCKLSPFGTYETQETCSQDTNCSARYRCAKDVIEVDGVRGENDVFGTFHPLGTPLIASDGLYNTPEECQCYTCDPGGAGCVPTTDGSNGTHAESTCGNACVYGYAANSTTGICELSLDAVGVSEEQCQIQEFQKNPAGGLTEGSMVVFPISHAGTEHVWVFPMMGWTDLGMEKLCTIQWRPVKTRGHAPPPVPQFSGHQCVWEMVWGMKTASIPTPLTVTLSRVHGNTGGLWTRGKPARPGPPQ